MLVEKVPFKPFCTKNKNIKMFIEFMSRLKYIEIIIIIFFLAESPSSSCKHSRR